MHENKNWIFCLFVFEFDRFCSLKCENEQILMTANVPFLHKVLNLNLLVGVEKLSGQKKLSVQQRLGGIRT